MYIFIECVDWINENENTLIWNVGLLLYCSNLGQTFNRWPALNQYMYITYNSKNLLSKYDHVHFTKQFKVSFFARLLENYIRYLLMYNYDFSSFYLLGKWRKIKKENKFNVDVKYKYIYLWFLTIFGGFIIFTDIFYYFKLQFQTSKD